MRTSLKVVGIVAGVIVVGAGAFTGCVSMRYAALFDAGHDVAPHALAATSAAALADGPRLLRARGCADCHGEDFAGRAFLSDPMLGTLHSSNLTGGAGSRMKGYSDVELERLIRHSVKPDGTSLVFMPSEEFWHLGDGELAAMIAALRTLPPVDRAQPPHTPSLALRALSVFGVFKIAGAAGVDHQRPHPAPPPPASTVEFGKHLAVACTSCHGQGLSGGRIPGTPDTIPVPTNLTPAADGLARYDLAQFVATMRTGKRSDGTQLDSFMPWRVYAHMTDDELGALYAYLRTLPPAPLGGR